jgi:hypothetical protein
LDRTAILIQTGGADRKLATELQALADAVAAEGGDAITTRRRAGLAETLNGIAAELR